mmetsp:Transcript_15826/g.40126  ORF Transcript_15826/g.40126 Transcript_15826/m.40126 type:complete len:145 (-) Transcript_15826:122-556(-)
MCFWVEQSVIGEGWMVFDVNRNGNEKRGRCKRSHTSQHKPHSLMLGTRTSEECVYVNVCVCEYALFGIIYENTIRKQYKGLRHNLYTCIHTPLLACICTSIHVQASVHEYRFCISFFQPRLQYLSFFLLFLLISHIARPSRYKA